MPILKRSDADQQNQLDNHADIRKYINAGYERMPDFDPYVHGSEGSGGPMRMTGDQILRELGKDYPNSNIVTIMGSSKGCEEFRDKIIVLVRQHSGR